MLSFIQRRIALLEEESAVKIQAAARGLAIRRFIFFEHYKHTKRTFRVDSVRRRIEKTAQKEFEFKLNRPLLASLPPGAVPVPEHYKHPQIKWRGLGGGGVGDFFPSASMQLWRQKLHQDTRLERTLDDALKRSADAGHLKRAAAATQKKIIKRAKVAGEANGRHRCVTIFRAMRDGETLIESYGQKRRFKSILADQSATVKMCDNTVRLLGRDLELTYELHSSHMQRHGHNHPGYRSVYTQRSGLGAELMTRTGVHTNVMTKRGLAVAEHAAYRNMRISGFNRHFLRDKDGLLRHHVMRNLLEFCMSTPNYITFKSRYTSKW